jgi:hypothetical protein
VPPVRGTSPRAFEGLKLAGRRPLRSRANLAVVEHDAPTTERDPERKSLLSAFDRALLVGRRACAGRGDGRLRARWKITAIAPF